jgi:hypothetical protein
VLLILFVTLLPSPLHLLHFAAAVSGGASLAECFEQVGLALFNYMTPIDELQVDEACSR